MDAVGLPVVHRDPVGIELGGSVGRPRIEWRLLILWYLLRLAIEFRCGSLVEPRAFLQLENPDRLKNTQSSKGIGVGGIFRRLKLTRSEEHTSELQSLMSISYAVFCLKKKTQHTYTYLQQTNKYTSSTK